MSTTLEVQDHKKFPRSKPRNKQGNDEEEKDAHIIIIDNHFELWQGGPIARRSPTIWEEKS